VTGGAVRTETQRAEVSNSGDSFSRRWRHSLFGGGALDQAPDCLGWLRTTLYPIVDSLAVELDMEGVPMRIVLAEYFYKATVALRALLGYDDPVKRPLLRAHSR
jgi:hypothetical protein